jgi:hypothetical protein
MSLRTFRSGAIPAASRSTGEQPLGQKDETETVRLGLSQCRATPAWDRGLLAHHARRKAVISDAFKGCRRRAQAVRKRWLG